MKNKIKSVVSKNFLPPKTVKILNRILDEEDNKIRKMFARRTLNRCKVYGKLQFETELGAGQAAKRYHKEVGPKLKPYLCRACKKWHIEHDRPPKKRRKSGEVNKL